MSSRNKGDPMQEALKQCELAYQFVPNSYTYSALTAV